MPNKRRRYRVDPKKQALQVGIFRPDKQPFQGEVVDVSAGGIGLFYPSRRDPLLSLRQTVHLSMSCHGLARPILAPSLVRRRDKAPTGAVYGFEFLDWLGLLAQLPTNLRKLFNLRGDYRVEPDPEEPIELTLDGLPHEIKARVRDISSSGLSFITPSNMETVVMGLRRVQVSFSLPDSSQKLTFSGKILHQTLTEEGICHGVCFDRERTSSFKHSQAALAEYLARRRMVMLEELVQQGA